MARTFTKPLTEDDLAYLRGRYSREYVARLAEQVGLATEATPDPEADDDLGDLIGYNPLAHTEREIREHLAYLSGEEKAALLEIERNRTDREPRKGVLALANE